MTWVLPTAEEGCADCRLIDEVDVFRRLTVLRLPLLLVVLGARLEGAAVAASSSSSSSVKTESTRARLPTAPADIEGPTPVKIGGVAKVSRFGGAAFLLPFFEPLMAILTEGTGEPAVCPTKS